METSREKRTFTAGVGRVLSMSAPLLRRWARSGYFSRWVAGVEPTRILILACAWVGDTFWATQIVQPLRQRFGEDALWVATRERSRDLWRGLIPQAQVLITEHIVSDRTREEVRWRGLLDDASDLRSRGFDVILDVTGNRYSALASFLSRPQRAFGCGGDELGRLYSARGFGIEPGAHLSLRPWYVAAPLIGPPPTEPPRPDPLPLPTSGGALRDLVADLGVPRETTFAVLAPGAGWPSKQWDPARFARLAGLLEEIQVEVIVVGGVGERDLCEEVAAGAERARAVVGAPLHHLSVLLDRARLVVSNDSAVGHLAAAQGVPVLSLFNSTNPAYCRPLGERVRVLRTDCPNRPEGDQHHCKDAPNHPCPRSCWSGVTPERLLGICRQMLIA